MNLEVLFELWGEVGFAGGFRGVTTAPTDEEDGPHWQP
jgi:hypothetical protein